MTLTLVVVVGAMMSLSFCCLPSAFRKVALAEWKIALLRGG